MESGLGSTWRGKNGHMKNTGLIKESNSLRLTTCSRVTTLRTDMSFEDSQPFKKTYVLIINRCLIKRKGTVKTHRKVYIFFYSSLVLWVSSKFPSSWSVIKEMYFFGTHTGKNEALIYSIEIMRQTCNPVMQNRYAWLCYYVQRDMQQLVTEPLKAFLQLHQKLCFLSFGSFWFCEQTFFISSNWIRGFILFHTKHRRNLFICLFFFHFGFICMQNIFSL